MTAELSRDNPVACAWLYCSNRTRAFCCLLFWLLHQWKREVYSFCSAAVGNYYLWHLFFQQQSKKQRISSIGVLLVVLPDLLGSAAASLSLGEFLLLGPQLSLKLIEPSTHFPILQKKTKPAGTACFDPSVLFSVLKRETIDTLQLKISLWQQGSSGANINAVQPFMTKIQGKAESKHSSPAEYFAHRFSDVCLRREIDSQIFLSRHSNLRS